ncbi:hypothetical protein ACLBXO_20290 [Methylobacterium sp. C33D]|uniref:hypothetical protein n=1 Tax=Methylobacterium mesophilicum TaxID=39956 RepID=UPI002F2FA143
MDDFDHLLNWKLLRGSHQFPGPDGGTCINEAAIVACGFPYQPVASVSRMPNCFSRPICQLAMRLNDEATDEERRRLLPFVTRLACADARAVELARARYIDRRVGNDRMHWDTASFDKGLATLEGALAIGRQADALGMDVAASRLDAARAPDRLKKKTARSLPAAMKAWLGLGKTIEEEEPEKVAGG